jgi:hypothetical protein
MTEYFAQLLANKGGNDIRARNAIFTDVGKNRTNIVVGPRPGMWDAAVP